MRKFLLITFVLSTLFSKVVFSQIGLNKQKNRISVQQATDEIFLDGVLEERSWRNADVAKDFLNKWPSDEGKAALQTQVRVTYDDDMLYFGIVCIDDGSREHIVQTLKRDKDFWSSDAFAVVIDPVNQQTNGYIFGVTPYGVQMEGTTSPFDDEGMSTSWDNKWFSKVVDEGDRWTIEIAIPFKTLRYEANLTEWGIQFLRSDQKNTMYSSWAHVPLQYRGIDLAYAGTLVWDKAPKKVNSNISLIPYINTDISQDVEAGEDPNSGFNGGLDAKVAVTSSLNLDLTVNPDFSQVEVDVQQTNLTRFSLFFPERRNFFLENNDLFDQFGIPPVRPFFSRRIGLDEEGNSIPILFGARLTGNLNEDWRVGLMSVQTKETDEQLGQNYSMATFQRRVLQRSSVSGYMINRQAFDGTDAVSDDFGRNAGLELAYTNEAGNFTTWGSYHLAFQPDEATKNGFYSTGLAINTRNFEMLQSLTGVGENYITDVGFNFRLYNYDAERDTTIRLGFHQLFSDFGYSFYPEKEAISTIRIGLQNFMVWNSDFSTNYRQSQVTGFAFFKSTANLRFDFTHTSEYLPFPTDLIGGDELLPVGWYHYYGSTLGFRSSSRARFGYSIEGSYGTFYNGTLARLAGGLRYRQQPWGNFELNFERNVVELPNDYGTANLWLVGPRIEINFSKSIFWTTFLQYNTQADNFNINSRLQWRFKPMSDVFLVYTDNYATTIWGRKNQAIVLKVNYWLTL